MFIGGTRLNSMFNITGDGVLYDISTTDGSVLGIVNVGKYRPASMGMNINWAEEVRSIASSYNANVYFLTLDTIGAISQDFSQCFQEVSSFKINHGYHFAYKSENFRPENGNGGNMAIKANNNFVYTQNGIKLHKRSLINGSILDSVSIPGGSTLTTTDGYAPDNNGIDIDNCGNVYVGSTNQVVKYNSNFSPLATSPTAFKVSDVAVGTSGNVIICGTTGGTGNSLRTGYVQSVNLSACSKLATTCCDAYICPAGPLCTTDAAITLIGGTSGGIWSGEGITNATTGTFNPSIAGIGQHTIYYTLPCGTDSSIINVSNCTSLDVCYNGTNLIASDSSGTVSWLTPTQTTIIPSNQTQCEACGGTWLYGTCSVSSCSVTTWASYATGDTVNLPSLWPLIVTNGTDTILFHSLLDIHSCSSCIPPPSISIIGTSEICRNDFDTLTANGGIHYVWNDGSVTSEIIVSPIATTTYSVTGTDANGCTNTYPFMVTVNAVDNYAIASSGTTATVTNLTGATYQWIDCENGNSIIPGEVNSTYTASVNGYYGVIVSQNGCSSTSLCVFVDVTNTSQNNNAYGINIYPNPTQGTLNIYFGSDVGNINIVLENIIGQKIFETNSYQIKGTVKSINFETYSDGFYYVNIINKNLHLKYKVMYEKNR
jgi:hypothetical protein